MTTRSRRRARRAVRFWSGFLVSVAAAVLMGAGYYSWQPVETRWAAWVGIEFVLIFLAIPCMFVAILLMILGEDPDQR